jgi:hypothetical protein
MKLYLKLHSHSPPGS